MHFCHYSYPGSSIKVQIQIPQLQLEIHFGTDQEAVPITQDKIQITTKTSLTQKIDFQLREEMVFEIIENRNWRINLEIIYDILSDFSYTVITITEKL